MNYYNELLESYLNTKSLLDITNLLFEQQLSESAGQIQVQGNNPQERINFIISNVPQGATNDNKATATYAGKTFEVWITQEGAVSLKYGINTYNLTNNPQGAYGLFEGEGTEEGPEQAEQPQDPTAAALTPEQQEEEILFNILQKAEIDRSAGIPRLDRILEAYKRGSKVDLSTLNNTVIWNYLRNNLGIDDNEILKQLAEKSTSLTIGKKKVSQASNLLQSFRIAFSGKKQNGSIAKKIANPVLLVDPKLDNSFSQADRNINLIEQANKEIKKVIERVKESIGKEGGIDQEKCEKIKRTIVPEKSQHLRIKLKENVSVLIRDNENTTRKMLNSVLATVNCSLGEQLVSSGGLRQVRGEFFEAVQKLVIDTIECIGVKGNRKNLNNCSNNLLQSFDEKFKHKKNSLVEALQAYEEADDVSFVDDGELDNAQSVVLAQLASLYGKDGVSDKVLRSVISMATRNYRRRKPVKVISIAKDTRFGKKGDLLELWNSPEECAQALKIPTVEIENFINQGYIRKCDDKECADGDYWGVDVSLKCYIEARGGVGLGSVSENTLRGLFRGDNCIHKGKVCVDNPEEIRQLRIGMATFFEAPWMADDKSEEYKAVQKVQTQIDQLEEKIDSIPLIATTKSILDKDKKIKLEPLNDYCKNLLDIIDKKFSYKEKIQSEFREQLEEYLDTPKFQMADPVAMEMQMRSMIKTYMTGVLMENKLNSKDEATRQSAVDHSVMSEFAAAGSRNPITNISIAGIVDNYNIDCKQNDLISSLKRLRTKPRNKKGQIKIKYNIDKNDITYLDDEGNEVYSSSISVSSKKGTKRRDSFITPFTLKRFEQL